jgi:hypothetical protein
MRGRQHELWNHLLRVDDLARVFGPRHDRHKRVETAGPETIDYSRGRSRKTLW